MTTTHEIPETTLERVRKLLAKAEGTDNEHERDTFMKAAASLMAKYGIEQAMVGSGKQEREKPTHREFRIHSGQHVARRSDLLCFIAQAMGCQTIYWTSGRSFRRVKVYGFASDIDRAEVMYTSLLLQMMSGLARLETPYGMNSRSYRNSWMRGFASKVTSMIRDRERKAAEEAVQESGASAELVLRDRKQDVKDLYDEENPKVRMVHDRISSREGFADGVRAGAQANLGGTGLGANRKALSG